MVVEDKVKRDRERGLDCAEGECCFSDIRKPLENEARLENVQNRLVLGVAVPEKPARFWCRCA